MKEEKPAKAAATESAVKKEIEPLQTDAKETTPKAKGVTGEGTKEKVSPESDTK